ncbi:MAG: ATP-dependent zinc metalloprotease FtsH [Candidatus Aminicenantes bacterium]|nr:ATP-dependent zinc metalloprotease FtsH [Candidatus Aminicenantes bacterium]
MNKITQKAPKGILFWLISLVILIMLWNMLSNVSNSKTKTLTFSEFMDKVENDQISSAQIASNVVKGDMNLEDGTAYTRYESTIPLDYPDLISKLRQHKVNIEVEKLNKNEWLSILLSWAPFVIIIVFWIMIMRQQGGNKAFSFGKSKARMFTGDKNKFTFKDVAGVEEAKEELEEIIEFLKEPKKFQRLGGKIPKGVLLIGPPGTGKTLLAKAIAGEANVPFFSISGSDFVELFVGVGASRVRDLFDEGKKHAPCMIFIDEIDAVGRQRGTGLGGGHDEREQTLNQLLVEMDGFDANEGVIIIAATNRPDILDSALLRPGRFDRRIVVSIPDVKGREEILKVHTRNTPLAKDVDLQILGRSTPGFTGADIANMVNEAALYASRNGKKSIAMDDFEYAKDKVLMGSERKSMIISEEEKRITAYHEAGHALIASLEKEADPLHKVSIIPRGMALGQTQQLPLNDKYTYSKTYLDAQLSVLLAGRISEEIFLHMTTTGAGNDFEKATSIARKMVCEWGMSAMGPISFAKKEDMIFLGRDLMSHNEFSEETLQMIDVEIKKIIDQAYASSKKIILENRETLEIIAQGLLEKESLTSDDIAAILGTQKKPGRLQTKKRKPRNGNSQPNQK